MNIGWQGFWRRWHVRKQAEKHSKEEPSQQGNAPTDNREERSGGVDKQSGDPGKLPRYPKELKRLLRVKLGLDERPETSTDNHFSREQNSERCAVLEDIYMAMRSGERQELDKKFEGFFTLCDDTKIDVSQLLQAIRRERRICESEMLSDSLYLVEPLERRFAKNDPEIMGNVGQAVMISGLAMLGRCSPRSSR